MEGHPPAKPYSQRKPDSGKVMELPNVKPANARPINVARSSGADHREKSGCMVGKARPFFKIKKSIP